VLAEVEIRGDQGTLRTLSGNTSAWRRLECNEPVPQNPRNFRFSGVDGRGVAIFARDETLAPLDRGAVHIKLSAAGAPAATVTAADATARHTHGARANRRARSLR